MKNSARKPVPPRVRELKVIASGFILPPRYKLLLPSERFGPILSTMIGYDRITNEWVTLYRYAAEKYPMERAKFPIAIKPARRVPRPGRDRRVR